MLTVVSSTVLLTEPLITFDQLPAPDHESVTVPVTEVLPTSLETPAWIVLFPPETNSRTMIGSMVSRVRLGSGTVQVD